MKRADLEIVLQISKAQTYRFWNEVKEKYIHEDEHGQLHMRKEFFTRGKLSLGGSFQQVYSESVRKLYCETETRKHKYLGYVFQLLPFINVEYNLLCHNPYESNLEAVEPMTIGELCAAIGYSTENRARLIDAYSAITFPVEDGRECFCAFVTTGSKQSETKIFVNPRVLYHGKNAEQVQLLGKFCEQ